MSVKYPPFDEKGAFVTTQNILILVFRAPVTEPVMTHTLLDLPTREIGIN